MSNKVLIVDDDPVIRILVGEYLSSKGFEVTCVTGGTECFEALSNNLADVVVLDFYMPGMNGMEILIKMREDPKLAAVPILMMSADTESKQLLQENNVTPNAFLQKPIELDKIVKAVEDISNVRS